MQFDFSRSEMIPLRDHVPAALLVEPEHERRGCWCVEPSFVALSGWELTSEARYQSVAIEAPFERTGWHHVFLRADVKAGGAEPVGLLARFSDEPSFTPLEIEQNEIGFKHLYVGATDLTGKSLHIRPVPVKDLGVETETQTGPTITLDCARVIPMTDAERDEHLRCRAEPATREVTGMLDSPGSYYPLDEEAASMVYNHAQAGFTKIYFRCFAIRSNNYWTKGHELARVPGTDWFSRMIQRYDVLAAAVRSAREQGVELHGVMRMNNVASLRSEGNRSPDTAFRRRHADKVMILRDGRARNLLSYVYPEVREHKIAIMKEIAGYGVDGIVIDSLRQPQTVLFEPPVVEAYREKTGRDPLEPRESVSEEWLRFRADITFTRLLREMRAALREMGDFEFTVRTFLDPRLALQYGCDVAAWAREGIIDTLIAAPCYMGAQPAPYDIRALRKLIGPKVKLIVKVWRFNSMAESENLAAEIYDQGADGVLLYQSDMLVRRPWARMHVWNLRRPETTRRLAAPGALGEAKP